MNTEYITEIFVVYKTDTWHSQESRELIGLCTNVESAIHICKERAKKEKHRINQEQLDLLITIHQSQGYSGDGEFLIEPHPIDTLI